MSYSYNYLQNEKQKAKGLFVAELLNAGRIWLVLSELAVLPARKTVCGFLLSLSLGANAPGFPIPDPGGGWGPQSQKDPEHKEHFWHQHLQPLLLSSPHPRALQKGLYWRVKSCREDSDTRPLGTRRGESLLWCLVGGNCFQGM